MLKFSNLKTLQLPLTLVIGVLLAASSNAAEDPTEVLKACARQADRDTRIGCYEELGQRVLAAERLTETSQHAESVAVVAAEEVAPEVATEATQASANQPTLPEDLGGAQFEKQSGTDQPNRGIVTRCQKGSNGKYYFFFDSGQVWQQVDGKRLRIKECSFEVSIAGDAFGYKMRIESLDKSVRVKRRK